MSEDNQVQPVMPTSESVERLHNGFNTVISDFQQNNPETPPGILMPVILDIMLGFPYEWLVNMGSRDKFVEAISAEAKAYLALQDMRIAAQDEMKDSQGDVA